MGLMTKEFKADRKARRVELSELGGLLWNDGITTFAWYPTIKNGDIGWFGTAICHPRDKFKRKYGEYMALIDAINDNNQCLIPRYIAEYLYHSVAVMYDLD